MKKIFPAVLLLVILGGCKDKTYLISSTYKPIYTPYDEFRASVNFQPFKVIERLGGLYIYDRYLFLIEPDKGIHFIENSNPSSPVQIGFLEVPGCTGLEIRDNFLYCNSYIDLLTIDISNISTPIVLNRVKNIFPQALPIRDHNFFVENIDKSMGVVTGFTLYESKEKIERSTFWNNCPNCNSTMMESNSIATFDNSFGGVINSGVSGSITKFALVNEHLYIFDHGLLTPFSLSNPSAPAALEGTQVWREVETLFPHKNYLFMGTTTGMLIYDVQNAGTPLYISSIDHVQACDPVVVKDNYAYVTIHSNSFCGGTVNQLDVINITDIYNPVLEKSFEMKNPHGLGIDGDNLFICDGKDGLKLFDASTPNEAGDKLIKRFRKIDAIDIIPYKGHALVIGENGLFQYDYSDIENIKLLSKINI